MAQGRFASQIQEVINRNLLVSELLQHGFNAYLPVYDRGIDLIALREADGDVRRIQLKSRWIIDQKYVGREVWIAFPEGGRWYLAPHDHMIQYGEELGYCGTKSWIEGGAYSCPTLGKPLASLMAGWVLSSSVSQAIES